MIKNLFTSEGFAKIKEAEIPTATNAPCLRCICSLLLECGTAFPKIGRV